MTKIHVKYPPPWKQTHADKKEEERQINRRKQLELAAKKVWEEKKLLTGSLKLSICYIRSRGRSDVANIIGGIADALQGIIYSNDAQIKEIHYQEKSGEEDEYFLEVSEIKGC